MKTKIKQLLQELNKGLVQKEDIIKTSLLTLLAQENLILIGPPGTAKSEISRRLSQVIEGEEYFEYLLTKFTTPEEIFGPLSITELKKDRLKRNTEGYMPTAKVAFLDEIFKANSSILNSLLTIINEKTYHNGSQKDETPLLSLVAASNELPIGDSELNALYDRFLIRKVVDYVHDDNIDELFEIDSVELEMLKKLKFKKSELEKIKLESKNIKIPDDIKEIIKEIRLSFKDTFKENNDEEISDRRLVKVLNLLRVSAHTNGRREVDISDILLLQNCLWNNPENIDTITNIVIDVIKENCNEGEIEEKSKNTAKGNFTFKGMGTKEIPFLIETIHDFFSLDNEEYMNKGYYFRQVKDIDLSALNSWHPIENENFIYDGNNNKILNSNLVKISIFNGISAKGYIKNISLENIFNLVQYNGGIIENCTIYLNEVNVEESSWLINNNSGTIKTCVGKNCGIATFNEGIIENSYTTGYTRNSGGISDINFNVIKNCYSDIEINAIKYGGFNIAGIAETSDGKILNCISLSKNINGKCKHGEVIRIGGEGQNNYALSSMKLKGKLITSNDSSGKNGKDIDRLLVNQSFFERTLKWDFNTIWEWDSQNNKPILKNANYKNPAQAKKGQVNSIKRHELQNKLRNNIWL